MRTRFRGWRGPGGSERDSDPWFGRSGHVGDVYMCIVNDGLVVCYQMSDRHKRCHVWLEKLRVAGGLLGHVADTVEQVMSHCKSQYLLIYSVLLSIVSIKFSG